MATIKKACKGVSYPKSSSVSRRLKTGGSFPDLNKDGKITKKDILIGKGVLPKTAKKGMTIKKAQKGYSGSTRLKNQMDANTNPTFNPSFTDKKGVTRTFETDTTGYAAGKKMFPYKKTISGTSPTAKKLEKKYSHPYYGPVSREAITKTLTDMAAKKQKMGGKTAKSMKMGGKMSKMMSKMSKKK